MLVGGDSVEELDARFDRLAGLRHLGREGEMGWVRTGCKVDVGTVSRRSVKSPRDSCYRPLYLGRICEYSHSVMRQPDWQAFVRLSPIFAQRTPVTNRKVINRVTPLLRVSSNIHPLSLSRHAQTRPLHPAYATDNDLVRPPATSTAQGNLFP
jgi:hypothetical protein